MKLNTFQKTLGVFYIFVVGLWAYIQIKKMAPGTINYWYSFLFGLMPFIGGFIGMFIARKWGGLKTVLGKAIFFFSLGLFLWGFGENIWSYYNFFRGEPAPYPSIADIGFAPSVFFWIVGTVYLAKASGALFAFRNSKWARIFVFIMPIILLMVAYYMLIVVGRGGILISSNETILKTVFDIAYPLGDFLALTFALVVFTLANKYLGGYYRKAIASILLGLAIMYFGDFSFSYTTTVGTFYNGNWGDLLLASGNFFMTMGILGFATRPSSSKPGLNAVEQGA